MNSAARQAAATTTDGRPGISDGQRMNAQYERTYSYVLARVNRHVRKNVSQCTPGYGGLELGVAARTVPLTDFLFSVLRQDPQIYLGVETRMMMCSWIAGRLDAAYQNCLNQRMTKTW